MGEDVIDRLLLISAVWEDDTLKVSEALLAGLDPNTIIRRGKSLVHYCRSRTMLDLLIRYGLDLSLNKPLLCVPLELFCVMIKEYNLSPHSYYNEFKAGNKRKYLRKCLRKERYSLRVFLRASPLIADLIDIVVDMCYKITI